MCVLSVIGTAAIINHQFTTSEANKGQAVALIPTPKEVDKDIAKDLKNLNVNKKNGELDKSESEAALNNNNQNSTNQIPLGCSLCHIPYSKLALPVNGKMKKCYVCRYLHISLITTAFENIQCFFFY